jgi:hypothetical protein
MEDSPLWCSGEEIMQIYYSAGDEIKQAYTGYKCIDI